MSYGLIGSCAISALIDREARIVWSCLPCVGRDRVFCRLPEANGERRCFGIELQDRVSIERGYVANSAQLETSIAPEQRQRYRDQPLRPGVELHGGLFQPDTLIRIHGRPLDNAAEQLPVITRGSSHIRFVDGIVALRLTAKWPLIDVLDETCFQFDEPVGRDLGADE